MNQPWLRAGLIAAVVLIVVNLLGLVPGFGGLALPLQPVALAGAGALAASFMLPRRETRRAAGQGALAGLIAGLAGGIALVIMVGLGFSAAGGAQSIISQMPPEILQQYQQMGVDPTVLFTSGLMTAFAGVCCLPTNLIMGALLGALGGTIYAAAKPE
jgi:hypothetical protein